MDPQVLLPLLLLHQADQSAVRQSIVRLQGITDSRVLYGRPSRSPCGWAAAWLHIVSPG
jgi:hypothetical protein